MPDITLRNAVDSYIVAGTPSKNYGQASVLQLSSASRYAYLFFNRPVPAGATVTRAVLRVYYNAAWPSSRTLTVRRVVEAWGQSGLRWNNRPATAAGIPGVTATAPAGARGRVVEFDVKSILQTVANGGVWHGFRIETTASDVMAQLYPEASEAAEEEATYTRRRRTNADE